MKNRIITAIIKPTSACNMRCRHCYNSPKNYVNDRLDDKQLVKFFELLFKDFENVRIIWHGGEPLLMGLDYYKKVFSIQAEMAQAKQVNVTNLIQTNGTLLNNEYINFFQDNHVAIGLSYDGIANDVLRDKTPLVKENINLLLKRRIPFGVLSVLCSESVDNIEDIYTEFNELEIPAVGIDYIFESGKACENRELLIDAREIVHSKNRLFDRWFWDKNCKCHFRDFEDMIHLYLGVGRIECSYSSCLYRWICMDFDGSLYPCARYYPKEYSMGNVFEYSSIDEVFSSSVYERIVSEAIERRSKCKNSCEYYSYCKGGCNNQALIDGGMDTAGVETCSVFKNTFKHMINTIDTLSIEDLNIVNPLIKDLIQTYIVNKQ